MISFARSGRVAGAETTLGIGGLGSPNAPLKSYGVGPIWLRGCGRGEQIPPPTLLGAFSVPAEPGLWGLAPQPGEVLVVGTGIT